MNDGLCATLRPRSIERLTARRFVDEKPFQPVRAQRFPDEYTAIGSHETFSDIPYTEAMTCPGITVRAHQEKLDRT